MITVLQEIHDMEIKSREVYPVEWHGNAAVIEGRDVGNDSALDLRLCLYIYLEYLNVFCGKVPESYEDICHYIQKSTIVEKDKILKVVQYIQESVKYFNLPLMQAVKDADLWRFNNEDGKRDLMNWATQHLLFNIQSFFKWSKVEELLIDIITYSQKDLGIDLVMGNTLIGMESFTLCREIFMNANPNFKHVFYIPDGYIYNCIQLNLLLLGNQTSFQCILRKDSEHEVFPFDTKFDVIFASIHKDLNQDIQIKDILGHLSHRGVSIIFSVDGQKMIDKDIFDTCSFPLIAEYDASPYEVKFSKMYICHPSAQDSEKIPALIAELSDDPYGIGDKDYSVNDIIAYSRMIANHDFNYRYYQELSKDDFRCANNGDIRFEKIFRKEYERDFVFAEVSNIIKKVSNNQYPSYQVPMEKIVKDDNVFGVNPFNTILSNIYYCDESIFSEQQSMQIASELTVEKQSNIINTILNFRCSEKYYQEIKDTFLHEPKGIPVFETRVMTHPGLLMSRWGKVLKVNASPANPVCYHYCRFETGFENCVRYENFYDCINEIVINPSYDEDFIIFMLDKIESLRQKYVLVPPTKEMQRELFLKQKESYCIKNKDILAEVRENYRESISTDLHYLKHDAAQYLSTINSAILNIENVMSSGETALNTFIDEDYTVGDALQNIKKSSRHINEFLKQMTYLTDKQFPADLLTVEEVFQKFVGNCLKHNYYTIQLFIQPEAMREKCMFDRQFERVLENLVSNAERHAFTNPDKQDYRICIDISKIDNYISILFKNDGTPPSPALTEKAYFTRGLFLGTTGHNGFGGSIIRDIVEEQGGIVHLKLNEKEFPFIVEMKLPIIK